MAASIAFTSGTTFTVPTNYANDGGSVLWIWYSGGGGARSQTFWTSSGGYGGSGGNGGTVYLIVSFKLGGPGGQYGVGVGAAAGSDGGSNASNFNVWPQSFYSGANPGGAGGSGGFDLCGGGAGAGNPGGGGQNGAVSGVAASPNVGGAAGAGASPWPSYGGAGGNGGSFGNAGSPGSAYGGGGGGGNPNSFQFESGGNGAQGIVYLYYNTITAPTISSASPSGTAYQNNGVGVTLGGTQFTTVTKVEIQDLTSGTLYNCNFSISSDSSLFIVPPAVPQRVAYNPNIFITNQIGRFGFSNIYTLVPNVPVSTGLTGPSYDNGTNQVNLNGSFFTTLTSVVLSGVATLTHVSAPGTAGTTAGNWWFGSDSVIGMFLPVISPRAAQNFNLIVSNPSGAVTVTMPYVPSPPTLTGISQTTGDESGGYTVTLTGSSFTTTTSVQFGTVACPHFTVNSDTSITVTVPAWNGVSSAGLAGGGVNVTLTNPTATTTVGSVFFFYTFAGYPALNAAHAFV